MAASPTARTLAQCRKKGFTCGVVETFVHFPPPGHRKDLFGCIDMIACIPGVGLLGIQATSGSNVTARMKKAKAEPRLRDWLASGGGFEVWGWCAPKEGKRTWTLRREIITIDQLETEETC
jgi:hypothetical protein